MGDDLSGPQARAVSSKLLSSVELFINVDFSEHKRAVRISIFPLSNIFRYFILSFTQGKKEKDLEANFWMLDAMSHL